MLHRHYPASSLLWASPTPIKTDYTVIDSRVAPDISVGLYGPLRFLCISFCARSPLSPRSALRMLLFVPSPQVAGFTPSGGLTALSLCNEAVTDSLSLGLTHSRSKGFNLFANMRLMLTDPLPTVSYPSVGGRRYVANEQLPRPAPLSWQDLQGLA